MTHTRDRMFTTASTKTFSSNTKRFLKDHRSFIPAQELQAHIHPMYSTRVTCTPRLFYEDELVNETNRTNTWLVSLPLTVLVRNLWIIPLRSTNLLSLSWIIFRITQFLDYTHYKTSSYCDNQTADNIWVQYRTKMIASPFSDIWLTWQLIAHGQYSKHSDRIF